jgi:hypothetical protein
MVTITKPASCLRKSATSRACVPIGPTRAISANVRGARRQRCAVAGRGRVDDHEVVGLGLRVPAPALDELPQLRHRDQLAAARRGGDQRRERADRISSSASCAAAASPAIP